MTRGTFALDSQCAAKYTWNSLHVYFSVGFVALLFNKMGCLVPRVHFVAAPCHYFVVSHYERRETNHGY